MRRRFPLVSALEFRFCRVNPLPKQKLTFDERKSAVSRGKVIFRREVIWFKLLSNRDFNKEKLPELKWSSAALPYDPFRSMADGCSALITMTLLLLLLLVKFPQCRRSKRVHFDHTATSFGKGVHRNIRNMSFILGAKIIWRSGHAVRSSFLLDIFFLCHSYRRVFTVFYVIHTFWLPNRTFNAQTKWLRRTR